MNKIHYCPNCAKTVSYDYQREETDGRGVRWRVYRCPKCKKIRRFVVT